VDAKFSETKWSGKFSETSATLVSNLHNYSRSSRDLLVKKAKMKLQMSTCLAVPSKSKTFITLWPLVHPLYLWVSSSDLFSKINFVIHLTIPLSTPHIFYFTKTLRLPTLDSFLSLPLQHLGTSLVFGFNNLPRF
jgi:hypothetical protein